MSRTVSIVLLATLAALALLAAGCGSNTGRAQSPGTTPSSPSPPSAGSRAGQVGDKFTVTSGDEKYDVTLLSVDQQAQPASEFDGARPGHHLAAAQFRVTAVTSTDENANNSATVTGSDEQAYTSSLSAVAAGTNFASGQIELQPGDSLVGWVSFELPDGVRVTKVRWTPSSGFGTHSANWTVNSSAATSPGATPSPSPTPTSGTTSAPSPTSSPGAATPGRTTDPADTVTAYFDAINLRDYQKAWDLGGKNTTSSFSSFVSGFRTTAMVSAQILDISGDIGTGVVTARVTSLETDGSVKVFEGTYTVKSGVITHFNVRQVS